VNATQERKMIKRLFEPDEKTKEAIKACEAVGYDLKAVMEHWGEGYALAEEQCYANYALKLGVMKFVESIKVNLVDSPVFPAEMRLMAKMLIANSPVIREIENEERTIQLPEARS
jgi:hypothetical protein